MFDKHIHNQDTYVHETRTVTEKRAPTDESVRLLNEMQEAARTNLVNVCELRSNTFNATWHIFQSPCNMRPEIRCRFELNGVTHTFDFEYETFRKNSKSIIEMVRDKIIEKLGVILTQDLFRIHVTRILGSK